MQKFIILDIHATFIILDIHATDERQYEYDIEMQAQKYDIYPKRMMYYLCRLYVGQLKVGDDYKELTPVVGIHFLDYLMFGEKREFQFHFQFKDVRYPELELNEDLSLYVFELPKIKDKMPLKTKTGIEEWLNFLNHAEQETEETMKQNYNNPMILRAYNILEILSEDEEARRIAEIREKALKDERLNEKLWKKE